MKRKIGTAIILFVFICYAFVLAISISPVKNLNDLSVNTTTKPTIVLIVDSLMSGPLEEVINQDYAPALEFLMNNGIYKKEVVSSYPTMSVTIDSTILTGSYTNEHKIPGLIWFNDEENRIISYGSRISEMWNNGIKNVALDSVVHLNKTHLSKEVQTIHEELASLNLSSASINGLVYRGNFPQALNVPKLISLTGFLPKQLEMSGPNILSLGVLSQYNSLNNKQKYVWKRMGINNTFTANELILLIAQNQLPAFTLAYLPDADASIHKNGPSDLKGIVRADIALQNVLNSFSTWEEALERVNWVILGDSGQSLINEEEKQALIDLDDILNEYTHWEEGKPDAELALAVNERMAYVYINDSKIDVSQVVDQLYKEERIAFIAWTDGQTNYCLSPTSKEPFEFSPKGRYRDSYNQLWNIDGNTSILDLKITDGRSIDYGQYPDALARLHGALHSQEGKFIVIDAMPSYEFIEEHSHHHAGGGAHGSLHEVDSIVPMIVTGTDSLPEYDRLVDIKNWIIQMMSNE